MLFNAVMGMACRYLPLLPGFHGDDCGTTYAPDGGDGEIKPILSVGHFNLTSRSALKTMVNIRDISALIVGFLRSIAIDASLLSISMSVLKDLEVSGGGLELQTYGKKKGRRRRGSCTKQVRPSRHQCDDSRGPCLFGSHGHLP